MEDLLFLAHQPQKPKTMKKILLLSVMIALGVGLMAQSRFANPTRQAVPARAIDGTEITPQGGIYSAPYKATLEDIMGDTRYDAQTNASPDNRLIVWPDGTISGAWTKGNADPGYSDRGTGYNYFNGTAWGAPPTQRIETVRTGWPSTAKWGDGEIVMSHQSGTTPMVMNTRPTKGTGAWTQTLITPPPPATGLLWPRVMTNGPNNTYVHMIVVTAPTGNGGVVYEGLDAALLYYRSLDGGATWDKNAVIIPGLDATNYDGFNGDQYNWGSPHGDTIYFIAGGPWTDTFIMKSVDNGETWTKIPVLSNANKKLAAGTTDVPPFYNSDGSCAVEMDRSGVLHACFGKGGGYMSGSSKYIYVNVNGLIYWNSTMPMVPDSLDLDTLEAHGYLMGAVYNGPNPGDTIVAVPSYRVALCSQPSLAVDWGNNVYCLWSAATPGNPSPDPYNYRHLNGRAYSRDNGHWTEQRDFNEGVLYMFMEFAFPDMSKTVLNDNLHVIYQTSPQPGSSIQVTTIPVHDNNYEHRVIPTSMFWDTNIEDPGSAGRTVVSRNYPNPVNGTTWFNVDLEAASNVSYSVYNVMGQKMAGVEKGMVGSGKHQIAIDCSRFTPGVYFYTVKVNGAAYTHKMIVE